MAKIIAVHSFRGGTGKSNLTANMAVLLAKEGIRVGIVDTDIQSPGIHILFRLDGDQVKYCLNDFLWGKCDIEDTAYSVYPEKECQEAGRVYLIPSSLKAGDIARVLQYGYDVHLLRDGFIALINSLSLDFCKIQRPGAGCLPGNPAFPSRKPVQVLRSPKSFLQPVPEGALCHVPGVFPCKGTGCPRFCFERQGL